MGNWADFVYVKPQKAEAGNYRIEIVSAEEKVSSKGNDMIVVAFKLNGTNTKVNHFFVKNEYFADKISRFFDAFPMLMEDGKPNWNFLTWVGCVGAARFKEGRNGYLEVQYFLTPEKAEKLPAWIGDLPERQTITEFNEVSTEEELPF